MQAWEDFIAKQEGLLGKEAADKWLRSLKVVHFDSGNLYLEAKDSFQLLWFEEHIRPSLKTQLVNNNYRAIKVHLTVGEATKVVNLPKKGKPAALPPIQFIQDKLDPAMTLDNFVSGVANKVIFQFLCEVLEKQATFNPIYLWGGVGVGKTHLLMALAQAFQKRGIHALYAKAETFTEHVVSAIRSSEMQAFRKAYRHVDVLLIDDVHLFARKNATQEEFFHTFNTLHTSARQIILSSKCAPALLEEIEPRLVSRFEWGINLHIEKLESKDLKDVLSRRCEGMDFPLDEEVSEYLLKNFPTSRSLQKALEALVLRSHLEKHIKIDLSSAQKMLGDLLAHEQKNALTPERIIAAVSAKYGIRSEDILGKSQSQECSLPRQIAMYLCRQELNLAFQGIGRLFSRDHSTVMTSIRQIEKRIEGGDKEILHSLVEIRSAVD